MFLEVSCVFLACRQIMRASESSYFDEVVHCRCAHETTFLNVFVRFVHHLIVMCAYESVSRIHFPLILTH